MHLSQESERGRGTYFTLGGSEVFSFLSFVCIEVTPYLNVFLLFSRLVKSSVWEDQ